MGVMGIVFASRNEMMMSVYCVILALILDFLDGFIARLVKSQSDLGRELDSLADGITFGALPGLILFQMILASRGEYFEPMRDWSAATYFAGSFALLVPMAAVYRLGCFNLDNIPRNHFLGLPTPSMTIVVMCIPLVLEANYHLNIYVPLSSQMLRFLAKEYYWEPSDVAVLIVMGKSWFYQALSIFLAAAMIVRIPMISLKFNGIGWGKNKWRFALIIWAAICYVIFVIPYLDVFFSYGLIDYLIAPIFMIGYFALSWIYATFEVLKKSEAINEI